MRQIYVLYIMSKFKDWFKTIEVGAFPFKVNEQFDLGKYDICINVSDEYYLDIEYQLRIGAINPFWFPMNEAMRDIGLNSIYGAMVIMFEAEKTEQKVYLHCHAGINRSRCVYACYYYMRTGEHLQDNRSGFINRLYACCSRGYLPPITEMEKFLSALNKQLNDRMEGGILDNIKISNIRNF